MSGPDEILDQIDHALQDWDVGPDAMRWSPEDPPTIGGMLDLLAARMWTHPPADLRGFVAAINTAAGDLATSVDRAGSRGDSVESSGPAPRWRRPRGAGVQFVIVDELADFLHAPCRSDLEPVGRVVVGFDGARVDADSVMSAYVVEEAEDTRCRRYWLNNWTTEAPGEGAR